MRSSYFSIVVVLVACSRAIEPLVVPGASAVALTSGPNTSMIYLARTADGLLAIDLGWWGHERAFAEALRQLDATPDDVHHVFLTHSHRDHVGAWRTVRKARFYLAQAERSLLFGDSAHRALIPRLTDRLNDAELPRVGDIDVFTFAKDTSLVFGDDTLRA